MTHNIQFLTQPNIIRTIFFNTLEEKKINKNHQYCQHSAKWDSDLSKKILILGFGACSIVNDNGTNFERTQDNE